MNYRHMPILSCSRRGLPLHTITGIHRELLPPVFTLTQPSLIRLIQLGKLRRAVIFCDAIREHGVNVLPWLDLSYDLSAIARRATAGSSHRERSRKCLARLRIHWESGLSSAISSDCPFALVVRFQVVRSLIKRCWIHITIIVPSIVEIV